MPGRVFPLSASDDTRTSALSRQIDSQYRQLMIAWDLGLVMIVGKISIDEDGFQLALRDDAG